LSFLWGHTMAPDFLASLSRIRKVRGRTADHVNRLRSHSGVVEANLSASNLPGAALVLSRGLAVIEERSWGVAAAERRSKSGTVHCIATFRTNFPLGMMLLTDYDTCMDNHNHTLPSRDDADRIGLGTNVRLCAPVSNGRRSEQLQEDTKNNTPTRPVGVASFLAGLVLPRAWPLCL
jgi:hypothetical protein